MVTDVERNGGISIIAYNALNPNITFGAFRTFRGLRAVKHINKVNGKQCRVNKHAFGAHRVRAYAFNFNNGSAGVKGLVNNLAKFAAINGISKFNWEFAEVHFFRTAQANFFVRNKSNVNIAVTAFFVNDGFQSNHNIGNGSFVICAKHAGAVSKYNILAHVFFKFRVFCRADPDIFFFVQAYIAALIVFNHLRMNFRRHVNINSIKMSAPANSWHLFGAAFRQISRQFAGKYGIFADFKVNKAKLSQILF